MYDLSSAISVVQHQRSLYRLGEQYHCGLRKPEDPQWQAINENHDFMADASRRQSIWTWAPTRCEGIWSGVPYGMVGRQPYRLSGSNSLSPVAGVISLAM